MRSSDPRAPVTDAHPQPIAAAKFSARPPARVPAKRRIPRGVLLGAGGFLGAISWQVVVPVLPLHLSKIGYSPAQIGTLVSLLSLAMGLVEMQVGHIVAAFGRRRALLGGLLGNAVCMVWVAQARAVAAVGSALAGVGVARAVFWPPLHATVAATASSEQRGRAFGIFWFWTSVAFLAGPVLGGVIAAHFGDRAAFYLGAGVSLLTVPVMLAVAPRGRPATATPVVGAREVLRDPTFLRLCLVNHLYYGMVGIWMTFLPLYIAQQGLSVVIVGWVLTVQGLTYAAVQIPAGRLADRIGPEWLILPAVIARALIALLVPLLHFRTETAFITAGALYGLAGGMIPVTFTALVAHLVPRDKYTTAMGVYNSSGDLGVFVGPLLGGAAALMGIWGPFVLCLPIGIAATLIGRTGIATAERPAESR